MPGAAGGNAASGSSAASVLTSVNSLNFGSSSTDWRAGTWPPAAQSSECWLSQLMNTLAPDTLFSSAPRFCWTIVKLCELAQTDFFDPICGTGATPHWIWLFFRSLICQIPLTLKAFLLLFSAR
jgi:hypothetical protein